MERFVRRANLPQDTKIAVFGEKYRKILDKPLISRGIAPVFLPENPDVDVRLSGHADLSLLHLGAERFLAAPYLKNCPGFMKSMNQLGAVIEFANRQGRGYPQEARLNLCICGERVLLNPKTADSLALAAISTREKICVRQGYCRCAVCVVNENAIITADHGVARAAEQCGIEVLRISEGGIQLDGFAYGFIGGAAFLLSERSIAFTGHLELHPDRERIHAFLNKHKVEPVYLTGEPIFDIGGVVQIIEKF